MNGKIYLFILKGFCGQNKTRNVDAPKVWTSQRLAGNSLWVARPFSMQTSPHELGLGSSRLSQGGFPNKYSTRKGAWGQMSLGNAEFTVSLLQTSCNFEHAEHIMNL